LKICEERFIAHVAAAMCALYPGLIIYSSILQTEALYLVFFLLVFLSVEALQSQPRLRTGAFIGLCAGIACLTRAAFFGFMPVLLLAVTWWNRDRLQVFWKPILTAGVVWCVVLLPWTWRNYTVLHEFVPVSSGGGMSLLLGNNPHATGTWKPKAEFQGWFAANAQQNGLDLNNSTEVQRGELARKLALEFVIANPVETLSLGLKKLYIHWIYPITNTDSVARIQSVAVLADAIVYLFAGVGVIASRRHPHRWRPLVVAIAFFTLQQVVLYSEARFRLPIMPLVALLSAGGMTLLSDTKRRKDFFHTQKDVKFALSWCVALGSIYAFTTWQFLSGKI
jgi:hypothetical protein